MSEMVPVEQKQVVFYDDEIPVVLVESDDQRQVFVPLRPICNYLGVDWSAQRQRVNRDPVLSDILQGVGVITAPSPDGRGGGRQEMTCLPLDYLNGWLFGINANRVKPEIRDRLIRYQKECYRVLADAFQEGQLRVDPTFEDLLSQVHPDTVEAYRMALGIVRLARNQVLMEARLGGRLDNHERRLETIEATLGDPDRYISEAQATEISQAIRSIALIMSKRSGRNEYGACWGEFYRKFGVSKYRHLPAARFEEAMEFLDKWHGDLAGDVPF